MPIAEATAEDIGPLCELLGLLFAQEAEFRPDAAAQARGLAAIMEFPERGRILVLRDGEILCGMVNLLFTISTALGGRVALLEDMVVHPAHRGAGSGAALLRAAIECARAEGCLRITLLTDRTNEAAQRFYQRHGFESSEMLPMRQLLA